MTLTVEKDQVVAANTPVTGTEDAGHGMKRVRFDTTKPLPTYLVAWAVGPFDVVDGGSIPANDVRHRAVPLRGIAVHGKGDKLHYALAHLPALLEGLEHYFGIPYPYQKLDIVAVPDFAAGAMENAGLITFREELLLLGDDAPEWQHRAYAGVVTHEMSHQWTGDLVTMPWWDDIWLNEAFATFMGHKIVDQVDPDYHAELSMLDSAEGAMGQDSLKAARRIRQPIETNDDIDNAFDSITYSKGAAVIAMFERYIGAAKFQKGIHAYLEAHAFGTATADDLLAALGQAAGSDVATPFRTFLEQSGVPFVQVGIDCGSGHPPRLTLAQSRYLPVGSEADHDRTWQIPVCVRYGTAHGHDSQVKCTLLGAAQGTLALDGNTCPAWVMPNADGAGYYRFGLSADALSALRRVGWSHLSAREKLAAGDSMEAAFAAGTLPAADMLSDLGPFVRSPEHLVATLPMDPLAYTADHLVPDAERAKVQAFDSHLYGSLYRHLGYAPRHGQQESGETALLRESVIDFMTRRARDKHVRDEGARRGRAFIGYGGDNAVHRDAVDPNLVESALIAAVQEGDAAFWDALLNGFLASNDAVLRSDMLRALARTKDSTLAARARALALDARLRVNEVTAPLRVQMAMRETREATWQWLKQNFDAVAARVGPTGAGYMPYLATGFCSEDAAHDVQSFFEPRVAHLSGGPRNLAATLEAIHLCAARVHAQADSAKTFFAHAHH